jgi:hypothetical protein
MFSIDTILIKEGVFKIKNVLLTETSIVISLNSVPVNEILKCMIKTNMKSICELICSIILQVPTITLDEDLIKKMTDNFSSNNEVGILLIAVLRIVRNKDFDSRALSLQMKQIKKSMERFIIKHG